MKHKKHKFRKFRKFRPRGVEARKRRERVYVVDTSVLIEKAISRLFKRGLRGKIIVPDAALAELEHLANLGKEEGFKGLDELATLHKLKRYGIRIQFAGPRPAVGQIRYARFGEIDAIIRELAYKERAILITADIVQAKSAEAYGVAVKFIEIKKKPEVKKKRFFPFFRLKRRRRK